MAIFTSPTPKRDPAAITGSGDPGNKLDGDAAMATLPSTTDAFARPQAAPGSRGEYESLIAPDLTVEGKIQGAGHIRIAGRFKGDVQVEGNLTLEPCARINGAVQARKVTIGGELDGNIDAAAQVEVLAGGAIQGDIKAGQVIVAAGARLRGHVDFGWDDSARGNKDATQTKETPPVVAVAQESNDAGYYEPGGAP